MFEEVVADKLLAGSVQNGVVVISGLDPDM
jgi:hypothetical protein